MKLIVLTSNIGYTYDEIMTHTDVLIYKMASAWTQTSIDVFLLSLTLCTLLLYREATYAHVTHNLMKRANYGLEAGIFTYAAIGYTRKTQHVSDTMEEALLFPLHNNFIASMHPPILMLGVICMLIFRNAETASWNSDNTEIFAYAIIMRRLIYWTFLFALLLGGLWAGTIFGWGGF